MKYEELATGLFRLTLIWDLGVAKCPVSTFLVQTEVAHEWIMIDAGFDSHVEAIVENVKELLGTEGKLTQLVVTHGHLDHIAAIPKLLQVYPQMKVLTAPLEKPFLVDGKKYKSLAGDSWIFSVSKYLLQEGNVKVPEERHEELTDGQLLGGVIRVHFTPGHTPGSTSFLHIPSKSIMVGDALMFYDAFSKCPSCQILKVSTVNYSSALESLKKVLDLDIDVIYPAHDAGDKGITKQDIEKFLKSQ
jgi:glyoxylase-like metal-dependent hydrolase (beta-lactamase superfamily II)